MNSRTSLATSYNNHQNKSSHIATIKRKPALTFAAESDNASNAPDVMQPRNEELAVLSRAAQKDSNNVNSEQAKLLLNKSHCGVVERAGAIFVPAVLMTEDKLALALLRLCDFDRDTLQKTGNLDMGDDHCLIPWQKKSL
jgi:hypothetical protein